MTDWHGQERSDYLRGDDAETSPTRSITIGVQVAGRSGDDTSEAIVAAMKGPRRRRTKASALIAAVLATVLAGCGQQTTEHDRRSPHRAPRRPAPVPPLRAKPRRRPASPAGDPRAAGEQRAGGLAYSTASAQIVQPQPAPGSCHAIGAGLYSRPDPRCTPGALNPAVTQANIRQTICQDGWTDTIRPPESVTEPEKAASMSRLRRPRADQLLRI